MAAPPSFNFLPWILAAWIAIGAAPLALSAPPPRPNIVIFLADDLGWGEVGYQGGKTPTPNIDALAKSGVILTQFYACVQCTPSRAAFMTGRYPHRYGLQGWIIYPTSEYGLPLSERLLPQALKSAGYETALVGKWHLGHFKPEYLPQSRGFDHQYGPYTWGCDYETHDTMGGLDWHRDGAALREKGYATDLIADEAIRLIDASQRSRPLFMLVSFTAPHAPIQGPPGFVAPETESKERRLRLIRAAMIENLDANVGRVLRAIDRKGIAGETLAIFLSDNGGDRTLGAANGQFRGMKGETYEGGVRVPCAMRWPGRLPAGAASDAPLHIMDLFPTLCALAGAPIDGGAGPIDGVDAWPTLAEGKPLQRADLLIGLSGMESAIRAGDWKLILHKVDPPELFNLKRDPFERTDRSAERPEIVKDLEARFAAYLRQSAPPLYKESDADPPARVPKVWGDPDAEWIDAPKREAPTLREGETAAPLVTPTPTPAPESP